MTNTRTAALIPLFIIAVATSAYAFGPDTTSTGVNTGQGIVPGGLTCDPPAGPTSQPLTCSGYLPSDVDGTMLDVSVWVPRTGSAHPLVVGIHGWGGSKRSMRQYAQRLTDAGFVLLSYSTRGFGDSYGQVNLADVNVEGADLRSMIGQVADNPRLHIDPSAVGVFGASYGGAHSYLAALHPTFTSPRGKTVTIRAIAPLVPWSELTAALRPNGSDSDPINPAGGFKFSFVEALYVGGCHNKPTCSNYPAYLTTWNAWMTATEPNNISPTDRQIVDGFSGYRSIYWQQDFWDRVKSNAATGTPQLPIFLAQGWTDDLFPAPEALRIYRALKAADPNYPITMYLGDSGHPRAATKPGEVDYIINEVISWFSWYLLGAGTQPVLEVQAAITRPANVPFNSLDVIHVPTWDALATTTISQTFPDGPVPTIIDFDPANFSGVTWDPIILAGLMAAGEQLQYVPDAKYVPPDFVPGDVAVYEMPVAQATLIAGQPMVTMTIETLALREQLNTRLYDVRADGTKSLVTRGTFTLDTTTSLQPIGKRTLTIPMYGNAWPVEANDTLRLEITNVDSPYIAPSKVPSTTTISGVTLTIPVR